MDKVQAGTAVGTDGAPPPSRGRGLRRFLRRLTADRDELEAEELRAGTGQEGATPIAECAERTRVRVAGTLRTVTLRPRGGAPALEAELYDGTDVISLVWLGRRKIAGIEPGRRLRAEGLVSTQDGRKTMFNPRYELRGDA
ncbi:MULTISPECIES: OB-fold nucleic acid binding domain-containing protein [Thermomonospora]|uniref:Nucleic acid binding OB-fold tRNA/helicase-type n=1 Tax=Thermomonospora curvata (strain ATCC 19995 / DSM 43183 / JCM 3096 / KCTC 9072 / NBRC 15933 / NCIMB 10081 / Henssen B9) TaxID=471852 RepID=D1AC16_THECD|nr:MULTISPECIES: OB-fold nucleic acid binding domain-containing protein [Thermomonospora]ACY97282.1 nucleic acid binding OB-fold tRNA/helicase-type [Thermomonospora curvata DSM 43183]